MLTKHNFNIIRQDANGVKYRAVFAIENTTAVLICNFVVDDNGEGQKFEPELPVTDLFIEG